MSNTHIDLKESIIDTCWEFGILLMDRDEIYIDFEGFFDIVKEGPLVFPYHFDEDEWDDELYFCYISLWELATEMYDDAEYNGQTEEEIDDFIQEAIYNYVVCY